ncbi:MAG: hypothetical protein QW727_00230 [Candidatus Pacearchaeota archaeon]
MINLEEIIFYILLVDAIGANIIAWFFQKWYKKNVKSLAKYFPATKGWTAWYLILVLLIGYLIYK